MKKTFKHLTIMLACFLFISLLAGTSVVSYADEKYKDLQIFAKVLNLIQKYYVEDVDVKKLLQGGIKGMLNELDPHTNYLPPEIFKEFQEETSGEFGGIGIEISVQDEVLTIISPIEDTPAWIAGIKAGDKVVSINGTSTKGMSLVEAAAKMKGKEGEIIKLGVMRKDFDKAKVFDIKRGRVKIKSVKYTDLGEGYGYFRITSFIENTFPDFTKTIQNHQAKHKGVKGLIIDLRNNPGGLLEQAVKMSDLFLTEGIIVSTMGRNEKEIEIIYAKKEGTLTGFPIMVIMNEYSASASEIFAGALQDNKRALILGQKSFGKGSVQSVVKLGDGSGLKLTVARYYTPNGTEIQGEGVKPDIVVDDVDPEAYQKALIRKPIKRESDIFGHLASAKERSKGPGIMEDLQKQREDLFKKDFQVMQAFNYLRASKVFDKADKADSSVKVEKK